MSLPSNQGADSEPSSSSYPSQLCREFTLPEIELATQNFDESRLLGSGGFAKVYRGTITYGKRRVDVAIKRLNPGSCEGSSQFWYEVAMLSKLRNPYLVSLIGYCNDGQEMIFVYDYMPRGTLEHCLHEGGSPLSWAHRLKICIHVASGLEYLHSETDTKPMILHLDVKSSNILLDFNGAAKLSDFGLSKVRPADSAYVTDHVGGTLGYLDPHFQLTGEATRKTDVFAFGVIMFEVLCGKKAYPSINGTRQFLRAWAQDSIKKGRLKQIIDPNLADKISSKCLKKFVALAEKCLHSRPMLRPTMAEVVKDLEFIMDLHEKAERASYEENSAMKNQQLSLEKLLKEFYIPDYILVSHGTVEVLPVQPKCPILVFINSKSGDQLGGELLVTYRAVLNPNQVFDLGEEAPDKVLHRLYLTLAALKLNGDEFAAKIEKHLRLIVAGGDGTASWLLGVISDLKLAHPPPIATMPLGTGNNLPFALGWGKKNPGTDRRSVLKFLEQVLEGKEMEIDSWHILMRMKSTPEERSCDHISPLELPHSLHTFDRMTDIDELNVVEIGKVIGAFHNVQSAEGYDTYRGGFWNYFSIGMDAQVSYAFHLERKLHPEKFKNQLTNRIGSPQGWFAASLFQPSSKNIAQSMRVQIMARHGGWKKLQIPHNIRSIVCLNLPSFSGGLNPWGTPNRSKTVNQDITPPYVDDGLLEVVGFRDPWHGLLLLAPKGHRTRLAQTHRVRFMFYKCEADCTYMRMDGEPWKQPLPADDQSDMTVEISYHGQVHMLATQTCISKSIRDPFVVEEEDDDDDDDNDYYGKTPSGEAWSKIGAAERFMIPEEIDISHLS